jgi:hypothetical protein
VQAADFGTLHDRPRRRTLDRPEVGCVLVEREVGARLMVIGKVSGQDTAKVSLAEDEHVIQALARIDPMTRSAKGFCQGLCGAVKISSIPMAVIRCRNCWL